MAGKKTELWTYTYRTQHHQNIPFSAEKFETQFC